jgi:hypothetical protein
MMPLNKLVPVIASLLWLPAVAGAAAQNLNSGSIAGVVRDSSGALLPGVTVEVSSPVLIERVRTAVSDGEGQYRVVDLRPGSYTVTFQLQGFSVVRREGIELTSGFTATVNGDMAVGAVSEVVTVTGAASVVDVQNVVSQNVLSRERLDAVPTNLAMSGLAQLTLGITPTASGSSGLLADVGGNKGEQIASLAVHGGRQSDQIAMIDGLSMQHSLQTGSGFFRLFFYNQLMTEEMVVVTAAGGAEVETAGVQVNMVPRAGSNTFRLNGVANGTNGNLQSRNISDELTARGVTVGPSIKNIYDFGVGVGGPLVVDKLWFYGATRAWGSSEYIPANYYNQTQGTFLYTPDLDRPADRPNPNRDVSMRFTWQATQKDKFTFFPMYQTNCNCRRGVNNSPATAPEGSEMGRFRPLVNVQGTWTHPFSNRFLLQAGAMTVRTTAHYAPAPEVKAGDAPVTELSSGVAYNSRVDTALNHFRSPQTNGNVTATFVTGSHSFKSGFVFKRGYLEQWADSVNEPPVAYAVQKPNPNLLPAPVRITEYALPTYQYDGIEGYAVYGQDQYTVKRLTVDLGLRFDYFHGWVPAQTRPAGYFTPAYSFDRVDNVPNWKDVSPRLGAAYNLFGDGRTAVKYSVGRYLGAEATTIASSNNPANQIAISATRNWSDPAWSPTLETSSYVPNCDLRNPAANGGCGALSSSTFGTLNPNSRWANDVLEGWAVRPASWQMSAVVEQQLRRGMGLSVGYYRTWFVNQRVTRNEAVSANDYDPFCVTLPADSRLPNPGEQICGFYDITPSAFGQTSNLVTRASNFGEASEVYNGVDVNVNARFGRGGLLSGGVATGRTVTDNCFVVNSPQELRYCSVVLPWTAQLQAKLTAVYPLPLWDIRASAVIQSLPGVPILATGYSVGNAVISQSLGRNLGSCRGQAPCNGTLSLSNLFEPNTRFEERLSQVDVRFSKTIRVGAARLVANFDIANLLNANTILNRNNTYSTGTTWGRPVDVLAARLFKFGAQFNF